MHLSLTWSIGDLLLLFIFLDQNKGCGWNKKDDWVEVVKRPVTGFCCIHLKSAALFSFCLYIEIDEAQVKILLKIWYDFKLRNLFILWGNKLQNSMCDVISSESCHLKQIQFFFIFCASLNHSKWFFSSF